MKSEQSWKLKMFISGVGMEVGPERIASRCIFDAKNENAVIFNSTEEMNPFGFNQFKMTFTKIVFADSIRFGAVIM